MPMFQKLAFACLIFAAFPAVASPPNSPTFPIIKVQDAEGRPIPGAQAATRKEKHVANFIDGWYTADQDGAIRIDLDQAKGDWESAIPEGQYRVMIRHNGYAPATLLIDIPSTQTQVTATMAPGKLATFKVRPYNDTELPADLDLFVIDSRVSTTTIRSLYSKDEYNHLKEPLRLFDVQKTGPDTFQTRVPEQTDFPLQAAVKHPGYLANYLSPDLLPTDFTAGPAEIDLPTPGALKVEVAPEATTATSLLKIKEVSVGFWQSASTLPIFTSATQSINTVIKGVVPGKYEVSIHGELGLPFEKSDRFPAFTSSPSMYAFKDPVTVSSGDTTEVTHQYPQLPADYFSGDGSATLTYKAASGRNIAGLPYRVLGNTDVYSNIPIAEGNLPKDQTIKLSGLRRNGIRYYDVQVGKVSSSVIVFKNDVHVSATRYIAPAKGEPAPELEAYDVNTSEVLSIAALKGKVIVLDFWATWCGPCQPSMQKLSEIAKSLPADLQAKVALVTISVDDGVEIVKKRLTEKAWENSNIHHYWYGPGTLSARGGPYGVTGIPHTVIIGKNGKIVGENMRVDDDLVKTLRALVETGDSEL